jgi:outer membrane protein assembly factor BamB
MYRFFLMLVVGAIAGQASSLAADWPTFRGPEGNGVCHEQGFPSEWSPNSNILWKTPLPGPGNSSPIVVGNRVFITGADRDGHERTLYCFHREDGRVWWQRTVRWEEKELTHKTNPFCPSSPVSDGKAVYVWHGSAGMHAYDLDGQELWSADLGRFSHIWGLGASPILVGEWLIQVCGPGERTFVAALHRDTGKLVWQTQNEPGGSDSSRGRYVGTWATPLLIQVGGDSQLVVCFPSRVVGLDPASGRERWTMSGLSNERSDLCYATPLLALDHLVVMGGFGGPEFGIQLAANGLPSSTVPAWRNEKLEGKKYHPQRIGSGIALERFIFMANADEPGSIECFEAATGIRQWVQPRTSDGPHWGSIVMADGKLYVPGQKGIVRVLAVNPHAYELIAENDLGETCNATPAFSQGQIFIRTFDSLYAIGSSP